MGFTDWFRRQATSAPPADLLGALIDAVEHRDANRLMVLINENTERIKAEFNGWTSVPEPIRGDQEALGRYVNTLLTQEFDAALADYRKVLELAPHGFFVAAEAADLLTREAAGEFPAGLYLAFAMLEHIPKEQQQSIAEQLVEQFSSHAPAWNLLANSIKDPVERLTAIERGLQARPDPTRVGHC